MKREYQVLIAGYRNGYLTTELITVEAHSFDEAVIIAEQISTLDGAVAKF